MDRFERQWFWLSAKQTVTVIAQAVALAMLMFGGYALVVFLDDLFNGAAI
jgi:hypothetical protein